ncbi:MAG: glycosyltransferase family 4 protein [Candidatus Korobacteraceae bacterium]
MPLKFLYVFPGLVPPPQDPSNAEMYHVGGDITVDVLLPTWEEKPDSLRANLGENCFPRYKVNQKLTYHLFLAGRYKLLSFRQKAAIFRFHVRQGLRVGREKRIDCVMGYSTGLAGVAAWVLSVLLRTKFILRIPNVPENAYRFNAFGGDAYRYSARVNIKTRVARVVSDLLLRFLVLRCDRLHLMYPNQLQKYPSLQKVPACVINSFTAMSRIPQTGKREGSVLLMGTPWFLKGADILIRAFRKIEAEFPDAKVRLLGYFPDEPVIQEMIGDSRQIEILKARPNLQALQVLADCSIYALCSRTDAAPRVVLEAMAAGKPVIGSRVGGVPYYIRDGETGLIFESENVDELAEKLRLLLNSPELQARLGQNGQRIARAQYNEAEWGRKVKELIELTVLGRITGAEKEQSARVAS